MSLLIKGASLLGGEAADLLVEDGVIRDAGRVDAAADAADAAQSVVLEQVSSGLAIRMAVLYHLLAGETDGGMA